MTIRRQARISGPRSGLEFGERPARPWEHGAIFGPAHWASRLEECLERRCGRLFVLVYARTRFDPVAVWEPLTVDLLQDYERAFGTVSSAEVRAWVDG